MKKYCYNCGELISNRRRICSNCGVDTRNSIESTQKAYERYETPQVDSVQQYKSKDSIQSSDFPEKNPFSGFLFFILIIPGLGQIFAGKKRRGFIIMINTYILLLLAIVAPFFLLNYLVALLFIWGIVDGIIQLRKYNLYLNRHGQKSSQTMKLKDLLLYRKATRKEY